MDVQVEFERALARVRRATERRANQAMARIGELTATELEEVRLGLRVDPEVARLRSVGEQLGAMARAFNDGLRNFAEAFNRGYNAGGAE